MKKVLSSMMIMMMLGLGASAQTATTDSVAQKMKDSLSLTDEQTTAVMNANVGITEKQTMMRQMFAGTSSLPYYLQKVEGDRDSLYKAILPNDKYLQFLSKKTNIISGN